MQYANTIIRQPLMTGLLLSIAVHAVMLSSRSLYTSPQPQLATGRTVVQLTLIPSIDQSKGAPESGLIPEPEVSSQHPDTIAAPAETTYETAIDESIEQDAALEEDKGVMTEAVAAGTFHPSYPRISKRRGEEGVVIIEVRVLQSGSVAEARILQSSGFSRLDKAAVRGALQTTFTPALRLGKPVESTTRLSYTFRLTDD